MREDWLECSLGDLLKLKNGYAFKSSKYKNEGVPVIRIGDIQDWNVVIENTKRIEEDEEYNSHIVNKGDILIAMSGATTGKFGIYNSSEKAYQNQRVGNLVLYSKKFISKKYIYYLLYSLKRDIEQQAYGGAQPNISATKIEALSTKLFPISIQKVIVKKIEELFSSLDRGISDLTKAQTQLKVYRQAVLKKAFEGIDKFKSLKECGEWKGGGTPSKRVKEYWENGDIPWVSSRDVKTKEIHDTERYITELAIPNSSTKLIEKNSLLFVMRSGILRRVFPIAIAKTKLCVNQDIQTVSLDDTWNTEYVYWFLQGNESDIRHSCSKDGTTVESIDANSLKLYLVPVCNLKEQHQIVREIESRLSVCDQVEKSINESLDKATVLRQSILKKAFEGSLLSDQEIAACKAHPEYEPASVLLERMKEEKLKM